MTPTRCACPHPDARACFEARYPECGRLGDDDGRYDPDERCECSCHDDDDDDIDVNAELVAGVREAEAARAASGDRPGRADGATGTPGALPGLLWSDAREEIVAMLRAEVERLRAEVARLTAERDTLRADLERTVQDVLAVVEGREPETWAWPLHALRDALLAARAERDKALAEFDVLRKATVAALEARP